MSARVVVAMSGGVDSSVAAALLCEQGYDVIGLAMRLAPESAEPAARRGGCCSYEDFEDARRVAEKLDFPFYVVDMRRRFERAVVDDFVSEYLAGRTPNPCARCNQRVKFDALWRRAEALGARYIATGHYARIERDPGGFARLLRARDAAKDQSYFLFSLGQAELSRTLFPVGTMTKDEVRRRARQLGLVNADKPESQEVCFVAGRGGYPAFVERWANGRGLRPGPVLDSQGRTLARHSGIHRFTIGQRHGLGVSAGAPLYVREIRSESAEVVVAERAALKSRGLLAREVSLVRPELGTGGQIDAEVKVRYRHPALPARVIVEQQGHAVVWFERPGPAVSPGQVCVFYRGEELVGGGFIERPLN